MADKSHADIKLILDPEIDVDQTPLYTIRKPASFVRYDNNISTSYSTNSVNFSVVPPSKICAVSKRCHIDLAFQFVFSGDAGDDRVLLPTITENGVDYLVGETDALRWMPFQSVCDNLKVSFNQTNVSINPSDYIEPLCRIGFSHDYEDHELSVGPSQHDQFQDFGDWTKYGSARNPLCAYGENSAQQSRGALRLRVTQNTQTAATVLAEWSEPILMSPFLLSKIEQKGFLGLQNMNFTFTLGGNALSRMWCHDATNGSQLSGPPVVSWQSAPQLRLKYLTVPLIEKIPEYNAYPYCEIVSRDTNFGQLAAGATNTASGSNVQLSVIPQRLILFVRERNADRDYTKTDTYANISNVKLNWDNYNDVLNSAREQDLYGLSVRNGLKCNWAQWHTHVGSVVCIDFGRDVGLPDAAAPGMRGNYNMQVDVTYTNLSDRTINYSFYYVCINEGTLSFDDTLSQITVGDVLPSDVLTADQMNQLEKLPFEEAYSYCGGSFISSLKRVGHKLARGVRKGVEFAIKHGPEAARLVKKYGPQVLEVMAMAGLGMDAGDVMIERAMARAEQNSSGMGWTGGAKMARRSLRSRM
jgi:hypothetical protein